jgi:membrane-associated protease RseP (regulator of RpoE activity)
MHLPVVSTLQIIACVVVAAAGLLPVAQRNRPFWGLYGTSIDHGPPRIHEVARDSPAESAGLRVGDVIVAVNGTAVDLGGLGTVLERLKPAETATLRVQRGEAELSVTARGIDPPVAMIYYQTPWLPVAGGIALALGLLVFATQVLRPAPRWRAALAAVAGFALAVAFFLAIVYDNPFAYWTLRRYHTLNWGAKVWPGQDWVGLVAGLALAVFGSCELRGLLRPRAAGEDAWPPNHDRSADGGGSTAFQEFGPTGP